MRKQMVPAPAEHVKAHEGGKVRAVFGPRDSLSAAPDLDFSGAIGAEG